MKKVLCTLLLLLSVNSFAQSREDRLNECINKYKNVPQAYVEQVLNGEYKQPVPKEAERILKKIIVVQVGNTFYADTSLENVMVVLVKGCLDSSNV